jgi:hypothetical protein
MIIIWSKQKQEYIILGIHMKKVDTLNKLINGWPDTDPNIHLIHTQHKHDKHDTDPV